MTPRFCNFHQWWTDGLCEPGKRPLDRHDLTQRMADIDNKLNDEEERRSLGFHGIAALRAERLTLDYLRDTVMP